MAEQKSLEQKKLERIDSFIDTAMKTTDGRTFLLSMLESCGVFKPIQSLDSNAIFYEEGKKSVGFALMKQIQNRDKNNLSILLKGE